MLQVKVRFTGRATTSKKHVYRACFKLTLLLTYKHDGNYVNINIQTPSKHAHFCTFSMLHFHTLGHIVCPMDLVLIQSWPRFQISV